MLHILLIILKIIGILMLVLLGVVLLLLLSVLLVPIRYRGEASFHGNISGRLKITWLLHILSLQISYEGSSDFAVRVFGKRILSQHFGEEEGGEEEDVPDFSDRKEDEDGKEVILSAQEITPEPADAEPEKKQHPAEPETKKETDTAEPAGRTRKSSLDDETVSRKQPASEGRFREGKGKLEKVCELYQQAQEFLAQESNQKTFRLVKRQLGRLLHHLAPKRLRGEVTLGLEDPYTMGQIVSVAALLYPVIRDRIRFTPVFGEKVLDGEVSLRGRIRVGTLLWIGIRVLLDNNFRKLLRKILNRGGK